jgi:hypothetical protein
MRTMCVLCNCMHVCACVRAYASACVIGRKCLRLHVCACVCFRVYKKNIYIHIYTNIYAFICACIYISMDANVNADEGTCVCIQVY